MLLMNSVSSPATPAQALSVALLQFNPVVGDLQGNARTIIDAARQAYAEGARLVAGGLGLPEGMNKGYFVRPTVFADVKPGMTIEKEEIFGPVACVASFKTDEEVIERANGTEFGLAAVVVSGNQEHAKKITDVLVAGTIWVNCFFVRDLRAPFGGSKKSGIGRDGGTWSFDFYADVKNTVVSPNGWKE